MECTNEIINISKITEGFFLGDKITATIDDVIDKFKISHIVNAAGLDIHNEFDSTTMQYLTLNWSENPKQSLFNSKDEIANKIVMFIDKGIKKGEGVLVHSVRGQNRACVVVLIYCMKKYAWSLRKSIDFIGSKKQDVDIPIYFLNQLAQFEGRLGITEKPTIRSETWSVEGVKDGDEMIMRNTYVNGLSVKEIQMKYGRSCGVEVKSLVLKNRKRVGWGDEKGFGLIRVDLERDLVAIGRKGNVKGVDAHVRLVPKKSSLKGRKGLKKLGNGKKHNKNENSRKERDITDENDYEGDDDDDNFSLDKLTFGVDKDLMERLNGYIGVNNSKQGSEGNMSFNDKDNGNNHYISKHKRPPKQYITNPMLNTNNNHIAITSSKYIKHHNPIKPHPTFIQLNNTSPSTPKVLYKREELKTNTNPSSHSNTNSRQLRSSSSSDKSSFSIANIHKEPPHYRHFSLTNKETPNNNNNPIPSSNPKFSLNNVTYFSRSSTSDKSFPSNNSFTSLNFKQSTSKNELIKRAIKTASKKPHSNSINYKHANFLDISNSNTNTSTNHSLLNDIKYQQYNNFIISDSNSAKNLCKPISSLLHIYMHL